MSNRSRFLVMAVASFACAAGLACAGDPAPTTRRSATTRPPEIRRGVEMSGDREERAQQMWQRTLAKVEPTGHADVARLPAYLEFAKHEFVEDTRQFAFDVTGEPAGNHGVALRGFVEFPEQRQALEQFFQHLGLPVERNEVELLPAKALGERKFALVTAPHAFVYDKPMRSRRETLTECSAGDALYVLKEADGAQLLCHAPDGYVGYVAADAVRRMGQSEFEAAAAAVSQHRAADVAKVIDAARTFLGTKYVWGGGTTNGVDCSGLVRGAYKAVQIDLPRDADQQSLVGRLVATRWHRGNLRPGDTLFFLGRRGTIHHTALYIGDDKYIEATEPVARISSFDPASPDYSEKRDKSFCFGKLILE
jgi:cell wall-associated NlpC family hydrolase